MSALLALALASAPAGDPRIITVPFRENAVVPLVGHAGVETTIEFGPDERIENVAIGDSAAWQVTPNRRTDMLFVKPLSPRARTNLTVVTARHTYFFDLVAAPGARAVYAMRIALPVETRPTPTAAPLTPDEVALAHGASPVDPATIDRGWTIAGALSLAPARVYADGKATYLGWPHSTPLPAILVRNAQGVEGPINFTVHDDMIVIDGVPGLIVLRAGKAMTTITHQPASAP